MKQKTKLNNKRFLIIVFLTLIAIASAFFLNQHRQNKETQITQAGNFISPVLHQHGDLQDLIMLSLIERTTSGSRFKIRVTALPNLAYTPISLELAKTGSERSEFLLQKTQSPYECADTHDYDKNRLGYETQWVNGNLEDYLSTDMAVVLRESDNSLLKMPLTLTHSCTIFSENVGQTTTTNDKLALPSE